jgi:23S rRNA G2069 N7-methylase RlmK/C1962 C5-methylase RlmI
MCNDTQSNHQLQQEEQQMQELLTKEKFYEWYFTFVTGKDLLYMLDRYDDLTISQLYIKEMGLPLDSIIEGL